MKRYLMPLLAAAALLIIAHIPTVEGDLPFELERGDGEFPVIDDVSISLENESGTYRFQFTALGTSGEGTGGVNLTLGVFNGTEFMIPDIWIPPGDLMFFGYGYVLEPTGDDDAWTGWELDARFSMPAVNNLTQFLDVIMNIVPDSEGIEEIEGSERLDDPDGLLEDLSDAIVDMSLYLVVRSNYTDGTWGLSVKDITNDILFSVITFAEEEGLLPDDWQDPFGSDDDTQEEEKEDKDDKEGNTAVIALLVGGVGMIVIALVLGIFILVTMSKKEKS